MEIQVLTAMMMLKVFRAPKVLTEIVHRVQMVFKVFKVMKAYRVKLGLVLKVCKVQLGLAWLVYKVFKVQ